MNRRLASEAAATEQKSQQAKNARILQSPQKARDARCFGKFTTGNFLRAFGFAKNIHAEAMKASSVPTRFRFLGRRSR
jgi:hypothetical protein